MASEEAMSFATTAELDRWLKENHATKRELWVQIYKKASGIKSVSWADCVLCCLCWGWIDGHKKSLDELSFLQRLTPRRKKSNWSKINRDHAERLIQQGRMQPAGLVHVEAAKQDGRWEQAYAGSADMVIPDDFLKALNQSQPALDYYATLDRKNLYAIYHRVESAKRPETRAKRIQAIVAQLTRGEKFY